MTQPYCLLIDNDEDDREIFALALAEAAPEIRLHAMASGPEALHFVDAEPDDLPVFIFIDMNMPGMDGRQCLKELRSRTRLSGVSIYMYSTAADPKVVAQLEGITGFLEKPTGFGALTDLLRSIVHPQQA